MLNIVQTILILIFIVIGAYSINTKIDKIDIYKEVDYIGDNAKFTGKEFTTNSITVQGEGKVFAEPDIFILGLSASTIQKTTADAQNAIKKDIDTILALTKKAGIASKDIQTTQITIFPEYEYLNGGENKIKGYRATHGLSIKIRKLTQVDELIGQLTFSDNIQIQSMSYDIDDKTSIYTQARKLAFEKAKQKAMELASLANLSLDKPLSISDQINYNSPVFPPMPYQANVYRAEMQVADSVGTSSTINPGQLEVTVLVTTVYGIK